MRVSANERKGDRKKVSMNEDLMRDKFIHFLTLPFYSLHSRSILFFFRDFSRVWRLDKKTPLRDKARSGV
jgi:hypothetical protein